MRYRVAMIASMVTLGMGAAVVYAGPESPSLTSSAVADVARVGDADSVRALLQRGADVNAAQGDGMTALHWAAERGDVALAGMLVQAGANVESVTRVGQHTPLHVAARNGRADVVELLLKAGSDATATTHPGETTALHFAAAAGNVRAITSLLDYDAAINAVEREWEQTPLVFAASRNRVTAVRHLLDRGADPGMTTRVIDLEAERKLLEAAKNRENRILASFRGPRPAKTSDEQTASQWAGTEDEEELSTNKDEPLSASQVQAAIIAGRELYLSGKLPDVDESDGRRRFRSRLNLKKKGGLTALLHAARQGHVGAVLALLDGGADINQASAGDGTSPLLIATINGQFDLANTLLERGADPSVGSGDDGVTPLWAAVNAKWQPRTRYPQPQEFGLQQATYLEMMESLLQHGAAPDARLDKHPWYMVYTGCGNRNCGLEDTRGSTAFWRAAYATDVDAMRLLVKYGADPDIPTLTPPPNRPRAGTAAKSVQVDGLPLVQPVVPGLWPATIADSVKPDPSGLAKVKPGDPGVYPIHAASGVGYGEGFAGNAHRHAPAAWLAAVKYLVEELGVDVNSRDFNGYNALHHAAARGDDEMIRYLVDKGCDVKAVSRSGQTTADMANGPVQRVSPFPETVALLESLGSKNNHNCVTC